MPDVPGAPPTVPVRLPGAGSRVVRPASPHAVRHRYARRLALTLLSVVALALGARSCLGGSDLLVPALAPGVDAAAAAVTLRDAGLLPAQRDQPSAEVAAGAVLGTEPAAGTRVTRGAPVTVLVSSGRPAAVVVGAELVGRPLAQARKLLRAAGLVPVAAYDGQGRTAGTVAGVEPTGSVAAGTSVVVHVVPVAGPTPGPTASSGPVRAGTTTTAPPRTSAPTRTSAPVRPSSPAPTTAPGSSGKGQGKGQGKGGGGKGGGGKRR